MNILLNLFYSVFYVFRGNKPKNSKIIKILDPYTYNQHEKIFLLAESNTKDYSIVLDIGAGSQWPRPYFEENRFAYHSCDIEQSANSNLQTFLVIDELIPVNSESYDLVISLSVLEHLKRPEVSINEIFRILKTGGEFFLQTNFLYPEHGSPQDYYRFTIYGLNEMMLRSGFEVISIEKIGNRLTLFQHSILYSYLNFLNNQVHKFFRKNNYLKFLYFPRLISVWLLNLIISIPLYILLIVLSYLGRYLSRKINVFYTGVAVHAKKVGKT